MLKTYIEKIIIGESLTREEAQSAFESLIKSETTQAEIASFLTALLSKGVELKELQGFHSAMQSKMIKLNLNEFNLIDLCGTGGDGKDTFNISTTSSFVLAGCIKDNLDFKVIKHGNYTFSSKCGSSNLLEELGVKFTNEEKKIRASLEKNKIAFLHAPLFHPAFSKEVLTVRRALKIRTVFNMLGPLLNPANPESQLIGVASPYLQRLYQGFIKNLKKKIKIVYSIDGYDEISLTDKFNIVTHNQIKSFFPEELNFTRISKTEIQGGDLKENKKILISILEGVGTKAQEDVVVANSAFALNTVRPEIGILECIERAQESIKSKRAVSILKSLI